MTERKEFCETCQRWLEHEVIYCPLFPEALEEKWKECICMIHTCYQAPKRRSRKKAPTYED